MLLTKEKKIKMMWGGSPQFVYLKSVSDSQLMAIPLDGVII